MLKAKTKGLIIEDCANLTFLLKNFLLSIEIPSDNSYTGERGLEMAFSNKYDFLIVDKYLPDLDGIEIIKKLRTRYRKPIILITGHQDKDIEIEGFKHGANIFHRKPLDYDLLRYQIFSLLNDDFPQNLIKRKNLLLDQNKRIFKLNGKEIYLTKTEFNFLKLLLTSKGEIFQRERIISEVMDYSKIYNDNVVDTMVSRIRKKLKQDIEKSLIKTVNKIGYQLNPTYLQKEDSK